MSAGDRARPGSFSWIATVYAKDDRGNDQLAGCGIVIDDQRVLTCAHVVGRFKEGSGWATDAEVRLAFPLSDEDSPGELLPVQGVVFPDSGKREDDLAVLHLAGLLPAGVKAAPLRCPESGSLASGRWRVLGFPEDPVGESASGTVVELARGWIRLNKESGDRLRLGFSGSGVWSAEYQAVVALVTQAGGGDGRALTLRRADACLPGENLGDLARWSLAYDREAKEHWEPRARGVSRGSHRRPRFQGRKAALLKIKRWLDRDQASRRVLVVTGAPGAGKSAVLARVVTTADPGRTEEFPAPDDGIRATVGSVGCAVHAKGKTALEVAAEVARAASAELPERLEGFDDALFLALAERRISDDGSRPRARRFNVIIDALDEAVSPEQARKIISEVILPVAGRCADVGAQVMVGLRRTDAEGDLLEAFGSSAELVDLDSEEFFAREDLAAYALATLQLAEREEGGNPYVDDVAARPVADRIAKLSDRNFLVAGLTAQTHGMFDMAPADPAALSFIPEVTSAMREYLRRIPEVAGMPRPTEVLTALAFAEAPGFPASLWRLALQTLAGDDVPEMRLAWFARSRAASFLVESSAEDGQNPVFRLFHQALNEALLAAVRPGTATQAEQALTHAFLRAGRNVGWEHAPAYLLRALPAHAARARLVDDLITDDDYLLHADLRRLIQAAARASSADGRLRTRLLRMTPEAIAASPPERAALFSVTEVLENLGNAYRDGGWRTPYRALCAATTPRQEQITFTGHQAAVHAMCAVTVDGETLLASGDGDTFSFSGTVRIWDPSTGQQRAVLEGHQNAVKAVCAVTVAGETLLASGDEAGTVRIWDPSTGQQRAVMKIHQVNQPDGFNTMCAVIVDGNTLLAVGDGYVSSRSNARGTVRVWDLSTGQQRAVMKSHHGPVLAVCAVTVDGETLLASGGWTVQVWDPSTGKQRAMLETGGTLAVNAMCAVTVDGETLLAAGNIDGTVRIWDMSTGQQRAVTETQQHPLWSVCPVTVDGETLLASGSGDGTARVWDPSTGQQRAVMKSREGQVNAVCAVTVDGRTLLAFNGHRTVHIWDLSDEQVCMPQAHQSDVWAVCAVTVNGETLLASGGAARTVPTFDLFGSGGGAVRLWDPSTGQQRAVLKGHRKMVRAVCAVTVNGETLLASGDDDGTVLVWDPSTGQQRTRLEIHENRVFAVCAMTVDRETLLAFGCGGKVLVWDLSTGQQRAVLSYPGPVQAVCAVTVDGETLLAYGGGRGYTGHGGTVRVWDPSTRQQRAVLEGHQDEIWAVCAVTVDGETLLASGGDRTVRVWDPTTGQQRAVLEGHQDTVRAVCAVTVDGETLLASGGDRTVRVWDPRTGTCVATVPTRHAPRALTGVAGSLAVGMDAGVLVIRPGAAG